MKGHGARLGRKREAAIAALLSHRSTEDAARAINVGPATLLRWLKDPQFQESFREARRIAFGQSIARLQQASGAAVSTLLKLMLDPSTPASSRVRAASDVLDRAAHFTELEDLQARLAMLEQWQRDTERPDTKNRPRT